MPSGTYKLLLREEVCKRNTGQKEPFLAVEMADLFAGVRKYPLGFPADGRKR